MDPSADAIVDIERTTGRLDSPAREYLDDKCLARAAFQAEPTVGVMVGNNHRTIQDMNDVGVIQNTCGLQDLPTNFQPIEIVSGESVALDHRSVICSTDLESPQGTDLSPAVIFPFMPHGICIDADSRSIVINKHVVDQRWLRRIDIDRCIVLGSIPHSAIALIRIRFRQHCFQISYW